MRSILLILCPLFIATSAQAQVPDAPFFGDGGVGLFDPTVEVVNSGAILDAQAVVSNDLKYVAITMRPTNTALLALQTFAVQQVRALGFAGSADPGILNQQGITPLSPN